MTAEQYNYINDVIEDLYEAGKLSEEDFEILDEAIEALEKAEKYKWHDLRKNPKDLPKNGTDVVVAIFDDTFEDQYIAMFINRRFYFNDGGLISEKPVRVDGWKYKDFLGGE